MAAAAVSEEKKLSLKIIVDIKAKKVVFAEADKEFIDFIFNLMSLPLSSVTKVLLLNEKGSVGCLGSLYKSIESLSSQYFEPNLTNNSVLKPKASVTLPLLSFYDYPASDCRIYRCATSGHNSMSDVRGSYCKNGCLMTELIYTYVTPKKVALGYVKGAVVYMVMDNLEVKPMSISLIKSLVKDFDFMEERQVQVGLQEGLGILKASLETNNVLTSVFLKKI
ncbi:uncharacterized protein LOC141632174 [Silene latifolia]|uniref:uncharacterized protein LOC141632174 n=1 Tax=Silene latifolia TaxID=37657 RepID=UPI003D770BD5